MSGDLKGYPMQGVYTGYGREAPMSKCDCGAPRDGKWANIHDEGCASLSLIERAKISLRSHGGPAIMQEMIAAIESERDKSLSDWLKEEREACAKLIEDSPHLTREGVIAAIRARTG